MTSYSQNLTEEIKTSAFLIKQTPSSFNILINGNDYTHKCIKLKIKNRLNEIPSAELEVIGLKPSNWDDISEGKVIKVIYGNTIIFKGIIQSIEPTSNYRAKIFALDSVCVKLSNWGLRNASIAGRYRKTATATSTIVNELCSENLDGASPFIVNIGTNTNYGSIDFRAENMTRLQALAKLAKLIGYDWWPSYPSDVDTFNIDTRKGSSTSVKTFYTYGTNQNCAAVKRLKDKSQLWNAVTVLGYGDGTNQVMSSEYTDATSISTWGRHEKVWTDKTLRTVSECNSLAQKILNDHKDPINKFTLKIHDVTEILPDLVEVGDQVTIYDNAIYLDTETHDYKVVAMEIYFGAGGSYITLECHSKTYAFLEDVMTLKQSLQTQEGTAIINDPGHSHNVSGNTGDAYTNASITNAASYTNASITNKPSLTNASITNAASYTNASITNASSYTYADITNASSYTNASITNASVTLPSVAGVSVWAAITQDVGTQYAKCYAEENLVGNPSYYTTRAVCLITNNTGTTKTINASIRFASGSVYQYGSYSLSNGSTFRFSTGETNPSNETGWFYFWDATASASQQSGTAQNIYTHTHGSHTHSNSFNDATHVNPNSFDDARHTNPNTFNDAQHTNPNSFNDAQHTNPNTFDDAEHINPNTFNDALHHNPIDINSETKQTGITG